MKYEAFHNWTIDGKKLPDGLVLREAKLKSVTVTFHPKDEVAWRELWKKLELILNEQS